MNLITLILPFLGLAFIGYVIFLFIYLLHKVLKKLK